ncbi:MAG: hypothetical protein JST54_12090 [Deltaproteobacteria bacterium]|nr:hypothetical protein [Deltaproteobacteria bacterium]
MRREEHNRVWATKAIYAGIGLTLVAAASSSRVNLRGPRELTLVFDAGHCTSQMDVDTAHCTVSTLLDQDGVTHTYTYDVPCAHDFESCGEDFHCDCTDVWRDAGMLWPDGGRCQYYWKHFRDGGEELIDGCRGAHRSEQAPTSAFPELQPAGASDFPIEPPLSKP